MSTCEQLLKVEVKQMRKKRLRPVPIAITILVDITVPVLHVPITMPLVF